MKTELFAENSESGGRGRRNARKKWRPPPIRLSRLPSSSGFDFPFDPCPGIFSGYTAGSEDSSSTEMSDNSSPNHSGESSTSSSDEQEENNQGRILQRRHSLRRMKSIARMKLRRSLMRISSGGADRKGRKLRKSRSIKLSTSQTSRAFRRYANSQDDQGSGILSVGAESQPHYLKPTSSSDSKKVLTQNGKNPRNQKLNSASTMKRSFGGLTRTASLRSARTLTKMASMRSKRSSTKKRPEIALIQDSSLLRATCSSALKDSKFSDQVGESHEFENASVMKVCPYSYCSLHGHRHANVPPLKRFVSMRRRLLKPQKSMKLGNRPPIVLRRSFSKKKRTQTSQVISRNDTDSNMKDQEADDSTTAAVGENPTESSGLTFATNRTPVVATRKLWANLSTHRENEKEDSETACIRDSKCRTETEKQKSIKLWRLIYRQILTGLNEEAGTAQAINDDGTMKETKPLRRENSSRSCQDFSEEQQDKDESEGSNEIEHDRSNAVKLVQQAFDEILLEIPDYSSEDKSINRDTTSDHEHVEDKASCDSATQCVAEDTDEAKHGAQNAIASEDEKSVAKAGESNQRIPKNWSYLKKVFLFKRFVKALEKARNVNPRKPRYLSVEPDQEAEKTHLRHQSVEERKNAEEWMLDHALRQVISTLAPSQKRKVTLLVQAFETLIPVENIRTHVESNRPESSHGTPVQGWSSSLFQNVGGTENEDVDKATGLQQEVEHVKECDNLSSLQGQTMNTSMKIISMDEKVEEEVNGEIISTLDFENYKTRPESVTELEVSSMTEITSETPAQCNSLTLDEGANSSGEEKKGDFTNGTKTEKHNLIRWRNLIYKHMVTGLNPEGQNKQEIYKEEHVEDTGLLDSMNNSSGCSQGFSGIDQIIGMEQVGDVADRRRRAVKLVQQAFEKILTEIPDRSSDEESISPSSSFATGTIIKDKEDLQHRVRSIIPSAAELSGEKVGSKSDQNTPRNWSNLGKVILLKRFVKALEKVRNFNPREPRYLPVKPEPEEEKIQLRHLSTKDKKSADEWMLDYALRHVISTLAPSQKRKVTLLVHAFDTVLDGGGQVLPSQDKETCLDSETPLSSHGTPEMFRIDSDSQIEYEKGKENTLPALLERTSSSKIALKENLNEVSECSLEEPHITATCPKLQVTSGECDNSEQPMCTSTSETNQIDLKQEDTRAFSHYIVKNRSNLAEDQPQAGESTSGNKSSPKCSSEPTSTSGLTQRIKMENDKNIKLWNLIYQHMVTGLGASKGAQNVEEQKIETSGNDGVKFVQQALDKILSEIPDHLSDDDQPIHSEITVDHALVKNDREVMEKGVSTSSNPPIDTGVEDPDDKAGNTTTFDQKVESKSNQKNPKSWSNLKKVILLKRFVKSLETLRNLSPRNPQYLPLESDPEAEKIRLKHQSTEGCKNAEEWTLDYALREAISVLAPSQKRKVALLAQAFDMVSLKDIGNCSSPDTKAFSPAPLWFTTSSPVQSGKETSSEISEEKTSGQVSDSGSREASVPVTFPKLKIERCKSVDNMNASCDSASQSSHGGLNEVATPVAPTDVRDNSFLPNKKIQENGELMELVENKENLGFCLEDDGDASANNSFNDMDEQADKSGTPQEYCEEDSNSELFLQGSAPTLEETEHTDTTDDAGDTNSQKENYKSLWRLLCKHMESGTTKDRNQPSFEGTSKKKQNNDGELPGRNTSDSHSVKSGKENDMNMENHDADGEKIKLYQTEALKLLEEAIDEISFSESHDDSPDDRSISRDITQDQELLEERHSIEDTLLDSGNIGNLEDPKPTQKTETEVMTQMKKSWSNLKKLILIKRFVKALEKMRKFNPREPRYLPLNPDPEAEKVNLRHQEMSGRKLGEEWMLDYTLQEVVAKLTPARKKKVQLLVQAFETVIPATGN